MQMNTPGQFVLICYLTLEDIHGTGPKSGELWTMLLRNNTIKFC